MSPQQWIDNDSWYDIWCKVTCLQCFSSPMNWLWQLMQYLIWDTLSELLLYTNELIMTVDAISDLRYPVWNTSPQQKIDKDMIYESPSTLCELLLLTNELIMTVDMISDSMYPVWTTSLHHWIDNDRRSSIWSEIPCLNYVS